jgi:hypothetical protein
MKLSRRGLIAGSGAALAAMGGLAGGLAMCSSQTRYYEGRCSCATST